jgi:HEAT repeat protein
MVTIILRKRKISLALFLLVFAGCSNLSSLKPTPTLLIEKDVSPTITLPDSVSKIIPLLTDGDSTSRIAAARKLGGLGADASPAVEELAMNLFYDGPYDVRLWTAWALGEIGLEANEAVPLLTVVLLTDFVHVRREAAEALGKIGDPSAMYALVKALDDKDAGVSGKAARAIAFLAGKTFPDMFSTGFELDENGIPIIVNSAKTWWKDEGQYIYWLDNK